MGFRSPNPKSPKRPNPSTNKPTFSLYFCEIPVQNGQIPVQNGQIPVQNGKIPVQNGQIPVQKSLDFLVFLLM